MPPETRPPTLIFDVNETLLDIDVLVPLFDRLFAGKATMRDWFAQLILYSEALTLADRYVPFGTLGAGVLRMLGRIHDVEIGKHAVGELGDTIAALPVHPDVASALHRLTDAGFALATLTNSPPSPDTDPLEKAGLASLFAARFTVDPVRRFKPHSATYRQVEEALGVTPAELCMIAAHDWDTIGAQARGWRGVLLTRQVNAPLVLDDVPQPDIVARDLSDAADAIIARWR